jgi:3-hydroxyacyl-CoA dehydrogenase
MNAIGVDLIAMMQKGLKRLETDFDAMVIANQAVNFSVGANAMLFLMAAQEQEWDEVHMMVRQFQNTNLAIKYASKPVVAAPQGMALGGGCGLSTLGKNACSSRSVHRISRDWDWCNSGGRRNKGDAHPRE